MSIAAPAPTVFGHPPGLFTLFFAEMWERFSYYGMRALLVLYMIKGFLGYGDSKAYAVYGAYGALVYMTPFFGGMLADRLLGQRRAVVLGGLLMAAGHLVMMAENELAFFFALALIICGNGFFKPNISTMVGSLYPKGSPKRDGGFTIFYMGINLGAAISPLLCGYVGETYGWHYGFGLATIGMLSGLAVFVVPKRAAQVLIMLGALATAYGLYEFRPKDNDFSFAVNAFVGIALLAAGFVSWAALGKGGLPKEIGNPPHPEKLRKPLLGGLIRTDWAVYLGTLIAVPLFALFVSGFSPMSITGEQVSLLPASVIEGFRDSGSEWGHIFATVIEQASKPAGLLLFLAGLVAVVYLLTQSFRLSKIPRERMFVALILTFFSILFWSFFEQAGSSLNNFADRNVNRVGEIERVIGAAEVGQTIRIQPTQAQLGYRNGEQMFTLTQLDQLREENKDRNGNPNFEIDWTVAADNVGMGIAARNAEIPASVFQSVNAVCILIFGLVFTMLWSFLAARGWEPSTPAKFAWGILQLGLGFWALWYGAQEAGEHGMVAVGWLLLGYLLHTTGEICLSPVGLSMVTKLAPAVLVSTVMGNWFLATAFSEYLAAIIAQFTGISHGGEGGGTIPPPSETVHVYGGVFGKITIAAVATAVICFLLVPLLKKWMHEGEDDPEEKQNG